MHFFSTSSVSKWRGAYSNELSLSFQDELEIARKRAPTARPVELDIARKRAPTAKPVKLILIAN